MLVRQICKKKKEKKKSGRGPILSHSTAQFTPLSFDLYPSCTLSGKQLLKTLQLGCSLFMMKVESLFLGFVSFNVLLVKHT